MSPAPARQTTALPPRLLIVLTLAVGLAHVLVLQATPMAWDQAPALEPRPLRPFITRTIAIGPAPAVAVPVPPPARPAPAARRTARRPAPNLEKNRPSALTSHAQAATEFIANSVPESPAENLPPPAPDLPAGSAEPAPAAAVAETAVTALAIPGSVRLKYAMTGRSKGLDYNASAQLDWLQDGQSYDASMVVSALFLGSRAMRSSGRITAEGLAPTRFLDKSRSERAAHFEADKGKISFSANSPDAPWLPGAQDRVSVFVQLASLLAGDPAKYPAGSTIALYTAGPSSADTWTFEVAAEETLALPAGAISAVKLTRKPQRDYDQTVEVWLAPSLAWLPVRNRITQHNGDFVDQQLRATETP